VAPAAGMTVLTRSVDVPRCAAGTTYRYAACERTPRRARIHRPAIAPCRPPCGGGVLDEGRFGSGAESHVQPRRPLLYGGTESSSPFPSSGESGANLSSFSWDVGVLDSTVLEI
jgi:hypothetical protein